MHLDSQLSDRNASRLESIENNDLKLLDLLDKLITGALASIILCSPCLFDWPDHRVSEVLTK